LLGNKGGTNGWVIWVMGWVSVWVMFWVAAAGNAGQFSAVVLFWVMISTFKLGKLETRT